MTDMQFHGMRVVVSSYIPLVPRVSLSADFCAASEGCIRDMNSWLLDVFGSKEQVVVVGSDTIVVGPSTYAKLRRGHAV